VESTITEVTRIPTWIDVAAVALGAVSGALVAVRNRFDVSGIVMLAIVTGLGGGIVRDTLLQQGPPAALTSLWLLPTAIVTGTVIVLFSQTIDLLHERSRIVLVAVDAVFLGVYAIVGTARGLDAGLPGVSCVLLGVLTGVGGGLLRDIVVNEQPEVVRPGAFMAIAAVIGCALTVALVRLAGLATGVGIAGIAVIVAIRLLSVWRRWESPVATDVLRTARRARRAE